MATLSVPSPTAAKAVEPPPSAPSPPPVFEIIVEPPDTASNWLDFNHPAEDLNSEFLMEPVNEADYDSETQICVDTRDPAGPRSFYQHFVTKRKKTKPKNARRRATGGTEAKGITSEEEPSKSMSRPRPAAPTIRIAVAPLAEEGGSKAPVASLAPSSSGSPSRRIATTTTTMAPPAIDSSLLFAGSAAGGVPKGSLQNAAVRRLACGRMPPPGWKPPADDERERNKVADAAATLLPPPPKYHDPTDSVN